MEDFQNQATDESVSSEPSVDSLFNFIPIKNNHEITSAASSIVGFGVEHEAVDSEQNRHHQMNPNNSGLQSFSHNADLSLSLKVPSPNPDQSYINTSDPPLISPLNWPAPRTALTPRLLPAQYRYPVPFSFRLPLLPSHLPYHDDQGHSFQPNHSSMVGMKNQSSHGLPLIAMRKNPSDRRIKNAVYDIMFEEVGQPMDPHLRLFHSF